MCLSFHRLNLGFERTHVLLRTQQFAHWRCATLASQPDSILLFQPEDTLEALVYLLSWNLSALYCFLYSLVSIHLLLRICRQEEHVLPSTNSFYSCLSYATSPRRSFHIEGVGYDHPITSHVFSYLRFSYAPSFYAVTTSSLAGSNQTAMTRQ